MKYNVHCYEMVRVMWEDIEANSPKEAAEKALGLTNTDLPHLIDRYEDPEVESLLECTGFIIDPIDALGQVDYDRSVFLNQDMELTDASPEEEA